MREQENYVLSRCASILTQERKSLLPTNNDRFDDFFVGVALLLIRSIIHGQSNANELYTHSPFASKTSDVNHHGKKNESSRWCQSVFASLSDYIEQHLRAER